MPTYRGNRGNLLQHWVLVELLGCIREDGIGKLCFVDVLHLGKRTKELRRRMYGSWEHPVDRPTLTLIGACSLPRRRVKSLRDL